MTDPIKIDIDGPNGLWLLSFAKRQLARFKTLLPFGVRRHTMPTGEEVTYWWGTGRDRIRITAIKKAIEMLVVTAGSNIPPFPKLMGLKLDPNTQLYVPDLNKTFDSNFPTPGGQQFQQFFGQGSPLTSSDKNHTTTLTLRASNFTDWYVLRNKGNEVDGPLTLMRPQPLASGRVLTLISGGLVKIVTFGTPETATKVYPTFDLTDFLTRAQAAWPAPFGFRQGLNGRTVFMIQRGTATAASQLLVWWRATVLSPFSTEDRLAFFMERYSLDTDLVPAGSTTKFGMTLLEQISREESMMRSPSLSGGVAGSAIFFQSTPGSLNTAVYNTAVGNANLPIAAINDGTLDSPVIPARIFFSHLSVGQLPTQITVRVGSSEVTLLNGTIGPGFSPPFQLQHELQNQHSTMIRIEDDEYLFIDAVGYNTGFIFQPSSPPDGTNRYTGNQIFTYTWYHWVIKNGLLLTQTRDVRTYNALTDSWDNPAPVNTFFPVDGHRLNGVDYFIGTQAAAQVVPSGQWTQEGFNKLLPAVFSPAVFTSDFATSYVYSIPLDVGANFDPHRFFIGNYKSKLFYVFVNNIPGNLNAGTAWGVPADTPTASPIQIDPAVVMFRAPEQATILENDFYTDGQF